MAVHTQVAKEDLKTFLSHYDIGGLEHYRGIAEGIENSNFLVKTTQGVFILTLFEERVDEKDLPFYMQLMLFLQNKGVSCPQPIIDKHDRFFSYLSGRPAAFVSFLNGKSVLEPSTENCTKLGYALANLHNIGQDFPLSRTNALAQSDWAPLWQKSTIDTQNVEIFDKDISQTGYLKQQIDADLKFLEQTWPHNLPKGIIHADLFPDNVFFNGQELSGFIDFYFACTDILTYDVAICLNAWCFNKDFSFNFKKAQNLLQAYHQVRPLNKEEQDNLPILAHGAAMRFFLTRFYDWFNTSQDSQVTKKNPLEYLHKLHFFRNIRTSNELGL